MDTQLAYLVFRQVQLISPETTNVSTPITSEEFRKLYREQYEKAVIDNEDFQRLRELMWLTGIPDDIWIGKGPLN